MKKHIEKTKKITKEMLDKMRVPHQIIIEETPDMFWLNIETEESPLLIGYRGENLLALEYILKLLLLKEFEGEDFPRISVDVGGYRKNQIERIRDYAKNTAHKVVKNRRPEALLPMNAYERRIVHTALCDMEEIMTESVGEEPARRIIIKPK